MFSMLGEAVQYVFSGNTEDFLPIRVSEVNDHLFGNWTVFDLLKRRYQYFVYDENK